MYKSGACDKHYYDTCNWNGSIAVLTHSELRRQAVQYLALQGANSPSGPVINVVCKYNLSTQTLQGHECGFLTLR